MKIIVVPLRFYIDLTVWYAAKPIEPMGKLFFVSVPPCIHISNDEHHGILEQSIKNKMKPADGEQFDIELTDDYDKIEPYLTAEEQMMHPFDKEEKND